MIFSGFAGVREVIFSGFAGVRKVICAGFAGVRRVSAVTGAGTPEPDHRMPDMRVCCTLGELRAAARNWFPVRSASGQAGGAEYCRRRVLRKPWAGMKKPAVGQEQKQ